MSESREQPLANPGPNGEGVEVPRIGVYVCQCGGNIGDVIDCQRVAEVAANWPDVIVSRTDLSLCSDAGQSLIEEDILERGVNRVVIGACAPLLHERTFRGTLDRAGLNPYLYYHVGLREQDSWVHHHDSEGATQKAIRLMASGVAKARLLESLEAIRLPAEKRALIIGGGVAGLRAAWDLARRGILVSLIEKTPFLGGRMAQLESVFPTGESAREALHELIDKVSAHPLVTVYTNTELTDVSGYVGDYQVTLSSRSRGVRSGFDELAAAVAVCPEEVSDPFNYGLTTRKCIYRPYPEAYPPTPAIDWEHCTRCGLCQEVNGSAVTLDDTIVRQELKVGAVVVATGFKPYEPHLGQYGYGQYREVITLPQLVRLLALTDEKERMLTWKGRPVHSLALIHCVGSRELEGVNEPQADGQVNDYCSRVCCTASLHVTHELRQRFPELHLFDFYEDIRTYGRGHEETYTQASSDRVRFIRFHDDELPEVVAAPEESGHSLLVKVKDYLTWGTELEVPVDLVVLAVGMMPAPVDDLVGLLKIARGNDRFLLEVHPKLRPVETAVPGVVLAGTAQGPMNVQESCAAASAAAAKVAVLLGQGQVDLEPFVARVNPDLCDGSGRCVEVCCYEGAIRLQAIGSNGTSARRAVVSAANCAGCGACVSACPNQAIDVQGWTLRQYEAMVEAIAAEEPMVMEAMT